MLAPINVTYGHTAITVNLKAKNGSKNHAFVYCGLLNLKTGMVSYNFSLIRTRDSSN